MQNRQMRQWGRFYVSGMFFTLVELLVVIAVIMILLALLLPGLKAVKGKAREIKCASNMKQIGAAWFSYSDDYNSLASFSSCAWRGQLEVVSSDYWWPAMLQPYVNEEPDQYNLHTHVKKGGVFWCPAWEDNSTEAWFCAYGMHLYGVGGGATSAYPAILKLQQIRAASEMLVAADSDNTSDGRPNFGYVHLRYNYDINYRHISRTNVLFADGRVNGMTRASLHPYTAPESYIRGPWRRE